MKNEILFLLLDDYADHEPAFLSEAIRCDAYAIKPSPAYLNKTVAPDLSPVRSCGGFHTLPDYSFDTMPDDFAALVLVGGYGWQAPQSARVVPIVEQALRRGAIVGAICNAASFLARHGFLNHVRHTGNGVEQLKRWGGENYVNEAGYVNAQAVRDGNLVTANGSGYLEFTRELLLLLENDTPEAIGMFYRFYKDGLVKVMESSSKSC